MGEHGHCRYELSEEEEEDLVDRMMLMLEQMFLPASQQPGWQGLDVQLFMESGLGHDVGILLISPLDILRR